MAKIYIDITEELNKFREEMRGELRKFSAELRSNSIPADPAWISLKEAKKILPYQSKKKWRELRNSNAIEFSSHGRSFLYNRQSLQQYIVRKSTLRASLNKKTNG